MTTYTYLPLAELAAEGVRAIAEVGNELIPFMPRVGQWLDAERMVEGFAEKKPANDDEPQDAAPAGPKPAAATTKMAALIEFMKILKQAPGAPRLASEEANDWLRRSSQPGMEFQGEQIVRRMALIWPKIFQLISRQSAAILNPGAGRAGLRITHSQSLLPTSKNIPTRQLKEKWDAERPRPQSKNGLAA